MFTFLTSALVVVLGSKDLEAFSDLGDDNRRRESVVLPTGWWDQANPEPECECPDRWNSMVDPTMPDPLGMKHCCDRRYGWNGWAYVRSTSVRLGNGRRGERAGNPGRASRGCCRALTATCMACVQNLSVGQFCARYNSAAARRALGCPRIIDCEEDARVCPDGRTTVSRDPNNNCQWEPCPATSIPCPMHTPRLCSDGVTWVGMDQSNNCEWEACPATRVCTQDARVCDDGITTVSRDPNNNCEWESCPATRVCTQDARVCDDGITTVSRDPNNNCEFEPCPATQFCCDAFTAQCEACKAGWALEEYCDPQTHCNFGDAFIEPCQPTIAPGCPSVVIEPVPAPQPVPAPRECCAHRHPRCAACRMGMTPVEYCQQAFNCVTTPCPRSPPGCRFVLHLHRARNGAGMEERP